MGGSWTLILVERGGVTREELERGVGGWDLAIDAWPLRVGDSRAWALQLKTVGTVRPDETPLTPVSLPDALSAGLVLNLAVAAAISRLLAKRVGLFMLSDGAGAAEMVSFCNGRVESAEANCDGELTTEAGTTGANEDFLDFFTGKLCDFLGLEDDDVVEALWDARSGDGALGVEAARALSSGSGAAYRTLKCRRCGTVMDPSDSFVSEAGRVCAACVA